LYSSYQYVLLSLQLLAREALLQLVLARSLKAVAVVVLVGLTVTADTIAAGTLFALILGLSPFSYRVSIGETMRARLLVQVLVGLAVTTNTVAAGTNLSLIPGLSTLTSGNTISRTVRAGCRVVAAV